MEIAVHQHLGLAAVAGREQGEDLVQRVRRLVVQGDAVVLAHVPFGEQLQFVGQPGRVVGGQAGGGCLLQLDQRAEGVAVQRLELAVRQPILDALVVGFFSQVGQQQQTLVQVFFEDGGNVQARVRQ
ncbi:hypothetical protein D9M68_766330 [compost metagenome]